MVGKPTLVLGASPKPDRYSNLAVRRLVHYDHPVVAVGLRENMIGDVKIRTDIPTDTPIHTVTLYMNENNQRTWEQRILALEPQRIIFNPGAENRVLEKAARAQGIETLDACTLVMLNTGQY